MGTTQFSVQTKILVVLVMVFLLLMVATTWHFASSQRDMVRELAEEKARDTASSYFDSVNTMMLTGTMNQREVLREKVLSHPQITEARMVRSPAVVKAFGPGDPSEQEMVDDLDRRALAGETVIHLSREDGGRLVTAVVPAVAQSNFRGTNCLTCHQVPEGTVLGASRVTYSLAAQDKRINRVLLYSGGINILMLVAGIALITWRLRHIVVNPLNHMREVMGRVEQDADLSQRIHVHSQDEIGQVSQAFNGMLGHFGESLQQVYDTTRQLEGAAERIAKVAHEASTAADQQRKETDMVATAINELEATAMQVQENAGSAAESSVEADQAASDGARTTREAIDGIYSLMAEIERAATVIEQLDSRSKNVGAVLDVIKGIAEQTNLLALNAAIEAARAGEQGRGFAVVADEVRTLANRSHESTLEIEKIVAQLQNEARAAVGAVRGAKSSAEARRAQVESADAGLKIISDRVGHIRDMNAQMAYAAGEQSTVTQDVSRNVVNISQLAERTASDAEETSGVSAELVDLSHRLNTLVARFKV